MIVAVVNEQEVLGKHFKVYGDFENPLFLAKDVAEWIEYSQVDGKYKVSQMLVNIDDDEKVKKIVDTTSDVYKSDTTSKTRDTQEMWFLTEDGLYEVLMLSRKPIAKQFKKEVKKILHTIRTTGGYTVPKTYSEALQIAADNARKAEQYQLQLEQQKPMIEDYNSYINRGKFCNFTDAANYLHIRRNELMDVLNNKYIYKNNIGEYRCYAQYNDLFALRPWEKNGNTRQQLMLTVSGLSYFGRIIGALKKERQEEITKAGYEAAKALITQMGNVAV